jgi:O-antigen ligase
VIVALGLGCLLLSPSLRERFRSLSSPVIDKSLASRGIIVRNSLRIGWKHPLLGVGYGRGRFKEALRPHLRGTSEAKEAVHAHNVYADIFAGTGIIGLLAFVWLLATTLVRVIATAGRQAGSASVLGFALAGSWIAAIVTGLGDIPFYHHETRIFFFTLLGAAQLYWLSEGKAPAL